MKKTLEPNTLYPKPAQQSFKIPLHHTFDDVQAREVARGSSEPSMDVDEDGEALAEDMMKKLNFCQQASKSVCVHTLHTYTCIHVHIYMYIHT